MTGTLEQSATARMRRSPPRGMHKSTYWVRASSSRMASRSVVRTTWMAWAGKAGRAWAAAWVRTSAMAWLEWMASLPPRKMVALPDLKHRLGGGGGGVGGGLVIVYRGAA